jgi:hypothetical protein
VQGRLATLFAHLQKEIYIMLRPAFFKLVTAVASIILFTSVASWAQAASPLKYDKSSEVKIKGVIDDVRTAPDGYVHLTLRSDKGPVDVALGPEKFLKEMEIVFAKGETIEVLGSQVVVDGAPILLAREVTRNGDIMMMRDEHGKPVWTGWFK